jgi:protein phosphatase
VLIDTVARRPELAGMGTTVSALIMVDDYAVIAHIGDSRIYLYRDDALTQITTDHTFVQRLVDSGRITPKRRATTRAAPCSCACSATWTLTPRSTRSSCRPSPATAGCSAPTASPASSTTPTQQVLGHHYPPGRTADLLLKQALDGGAPTTSPSSSSTWAAATRCSAAPRRSSARPPTRRASTCRPPAPGRTSWLHTARQAANEPTHFEPAAEFLEELIEEDRRRAAVGASGGSSA